MAVAAAVKVTRDAHRQTVLVQELQRVGEMFVGDFRLPLSPSLLVRGLDIEVRGRAEWGEGGGRREGGGGRENDRQQKEVSKGISISLKKYILLS